MNRLTTRSRIDLEQLADRIVPSATPLDLRTEGASEGACRCHRDPGRCPTDGDRLYPLVRSRPVRRERIVGSGAGVQHDRATAPVRRESRARSSRGAPARRGADRTVGDTSTASSCSISTRRGRRRTLSLDEVRSTSASRDLTGYDRTAKTLAGLEAAFDLDERATSPCFWTTG